MLSLLTLPENVQSLLAVKFVRFGLYLLNSAVQFTTKRYNLYVMRRMAAVIKNKAVPSSLMPKCK